MSSETASANLSAVAKVRDLRSYGSLTALTVRATQWANKAMRLSWISSATKAHRLVTSRGICLAQLAWRPRLPGRSVLDPVRVRGQVRLDRLDADNMRVRAEIEDLRGER